VREALSVLFCNNPYLYIDVTLIRPLATPSTILRTGFSQREKEMISCALCGYRIFFLNFRTATVMTTAENSTRNSAWGQSTANPTSLR